MLDPFRIANQYGLFAVMTRGRYEIEFQGSNDGVNWTAVSIPQQAAGAERGAAHLRALSAALRLEPVVRLARRLARERDCSQSRRSGCCLATTDVLALFRGNPFPQDPPRYVRAVLWQYWFTSMDEKRQHRRLVAERSSWASTRRS